MHDSKGRREQVMKYATLYGQRLGLIILPKIATNKKQCREMIENSAYKGGRWKLNGLYGSAFNDANFIFIHLSTIPNTYVLRDTIAHELLHIAKPKLRHSQDFNTQVRSIVSGRYEQ